MAAGGFELSGADVEMRRAVEKVGHTIRRLRRQKGMTQRLLADFASLHHTYVGGVERGERNPSLRALLRIARALKVPPEELLGGLDY